MWIYLNPILYTSMILFFVLALLGTPAKEAGTSGSNCSCSERAHTREEEIAQHVRRGRLHTSREQPHNQERGYPGINPLITGFQTNCITPPSQACWFLKDPRSYYWSLLILYRKGNKQRKEKKFFNFIVQQVAAHWLALIIEIFMVITSRTNHRTTWRSAFLSNEGLKWLVI